MSTALIGLACRAMTGTPARHGIEAALNPRIAATNAASGEPSAAQGTVALQRLDGIMTATRLIAAVGANEGAQRPLIEPHQQNEYRSHHCNTPSFARARRKSSISNVNRRLRVLSRPIRTRSTPCRSVVFSTARAASRRRRRVRLRMTALPTFFVTVKPRRAGLSSSRISACRTKPDDGVLRPLLATSKNSARRFSLPGDGRPVRSPDPSSAGDRESCPGARPRPGI